MKAIESKQITLIWANDGWCYIPQLKIRQRFTDKLYYQEDWTGVIAMPENIETTDWVLYSKEPRIWQEQGDVFSIAKKSKAKRAGMTKRDQRFQQQ